MKWLYLTNSTSKLRLTLRYLPAQPIPALGEMLITYQSHVDGDMHRKLVCAADDNAPSWLRWRVVDASPGCLEVIDQFSPAMRDYLTNPNLSNQWYSLAAKIIYPMVLREPVLYTDDDVLILRDFSPLITQSFGSYNRLCALRYNNADSVIASQLGTACGLPEFDQFDYNEHRLDAGVWFIKDCDWDDYKNCLIRASHCAYWMRQKRNVHAFRMLDQRFLTVFGFKNNWQVIKKHKYYRAAETNMLNGKFDQFLNTTFAHYSFKTLKPKFQQMLEERLDVQHG